MEHTASKSEWTPMTRKKMIGARAADYTVTVSSIGKILAVIADEDGVTPMTRAIEAGIAAGIEDAVTDEFLTKVPLSCPDIRTFLASYPCLIQRPGRVQSIFPPGNEGQTPMCAIRQ